MYTNDQQNCPKICVHVVDHLTTRENIKIILFLLFFILHSFCLISFLDEWLHEIRKMIKSSFYHKSFLYFSFLSYVYSQRTITSYLITYFSSKCTLMSIIVIDSNDQFKLLYRLSSINRY